MHPLEAKLAAELAECEGKRLFLAVSGGPDSVAMLRGICAGGNETTSSILVGHFNHRLRAQADRDQQFVDDLCRSLGVVCALGQAEGDLHQRTTGIGLEAAARHARYRFVGRLAIETGADYVLTAHTADDQAETVLHRVIRGTGLRGLSGIRRSRPLCGQVQLLRPMLGITRAEVIDYLQSIGQEACHDCTNDESKQTRNRIRNDLLPLLRRDYNPDVTGSLLRLANLAGEVNEMTDRLTEELVQSCVTFCNSQVVEIHVGRLAAESSYLVRQVLNRAWQLQNWPERDMDHRHWVTLEAMVRIGRPSAHSLPGGVCAKRKGEQLLLTRPSELPAIN
jgi:tRNA(Ile)-lysidine synthase